MYDTVNTISRLEDLMNLFEILLKLFVFDKYMMELRDNVITLTIITPTLNTSTVTDSLCNSGAFNNLNAVRDCPFNLKEEAWFLSRSRKFFSYAALLFLKHFSAAQQNIFLLKKILFHVDLIKMLSLMFVSSIPVIFSSKFRIAKIHGLPFQEVVS